MSSKVPIPMPIEDLIYDVGMNNGDDTAYYLSLGFRVVAIDANPELVERAKARFANEIASQRLIILNVGIADQRGSFPSGFADARSRIGVRSIERMHRGVIRPTTQSRSHVPALRLLSRNMECRFFARSTFRVTMAYALKALKLTTFQNFSQWRHSILTSSCSISSRRLDIRSLNASNNPLFCRCNFLQYRNNTLPSAPSRYSSVQNFGIGSFANSAAVPGCRTSFRAPVITMAGIFRLKVQEDSVTRPWADG